MSCDYHILGMHPRTIEVNIAIMRAFVRLREILASHKDLARKLDELERKWGLTTQPLAA